MLMATFVRRPEDLVRGHSRPGGDQVQGVAEEVRGGKHFHRRQAPEARGCRRTHWKGDDDGGGDGGGGDDDGGCDSDDDDDGGGGGGDDDSGCDGDDDGGGGDDDGSGGDDDADDDMVCT